MGEGVNDDCAHRSRVLPNLRSKIKQRDDYTDRRDQLRHGVDRFEVHNDALANRAMFDEAEVNCSHSSVGCLFIRRAATEQSRVGWKISFSS